jgi:cell division protein FtsI (penicillin-binding protein 3)
MSAGAERWIRTRILCSVGLVVLLFGGVTFKAYKLHADDGDRLREMADQQYLKRSKLAPRRGTITDRHGTPLAVSVDVDSIFANPRMIGSAAPAVARQLAQLLDLDVWALQKKLSTRRYFVWVKRRIGPGPARQVRELKIRGVSLTKESRRFYPNHALAGSVIGFAGLDAKGLEGVELSLERWLRGNTVRVAGLRDALGRSVLSDGLKQAPSSGHTVKLSLDKFIQFETEQALKEAYLEVMPKTGWVAAVVMDPRTGDLLSMASEPSFDPNRYGKAKPWQRRNRSVTDAFEPGSTLKVFSVGAALHAGLIKPDEVIPCEKGRWKVGHYTIHDSHRYDELDVAGILKKSSNIGVAKIGFRLGKQGLYSGLRRFGFGQRTQVMFPGERAGVLRDPRRWSDVGLANISFGQGMTTTVLQLAQALSAVANKGKMMRPRLVLEVRDQLGQIVQEVRPGGRQVIAPWVARSLLRMLEGVTEEGGTGVDAAMEHFRVAGKTGTAQKVDPVTGTYSTDRWLSSFIGVVPVSKPRLAIVVVVNDPDGEKHYGGEVAGPIFKRIAGKALGYLGVKPDRFERSTKAARRPQRPATEGFVVMSDPAPPLPGEGRPRGRILVPDFTGMSITEVITEARKAGLRLELLGSGRAVAQSPGPGPTPQGTLCRVSFRPPG